MHLTVSGIHFCAAHILPDHAKCGRLHGHNYDLVVDLKGNIEADGMIIDFSRAKKIIKNIIAPLDHKFIIAEKNKGLTIERKNNQVLISIGEKNYAFPEEDVVSLPILNTSCECLVEYLYKRLIAELGMDVTVQLNETSTSKATFP